MLPDQLAAEARFFERSPGIALEKFQTKRVMLALKGSYLFILK
jgi:hypothetical protein